MVEVDIDTFHSMTPFIFGLLAWPTQSPHLACKRSFIIALYSAAAHCTQMLFIVVYCCNLSLLFSTAWFSQTKNSGCVMCWMNFRPLFIIWEWHQLVFCLFSSSASFSFIQASESLSLMYPLAVYFTYSIRSYGRIDLEFPDTRLSSQMNEDHWK